MERRKRNKRIRTNGSGSVSYAESTVPLSKEIASRKNSQEGFDFIFNELPNPDPVLQKSGNRIEVYKELRSDAKVEAVTASRKAGVKKYKATIEENDADSRMIEACETLITKRWDIWSLIDEILEGAEFGYKPFELIWKFSDGLILPVGAPKDDSGKDIKSESPGLIGKPPEWFNYSSDNKLQFISRDNLDGEPVPENKFVVARRRATYANPYGEAYLSSVFWPAVFKKNGVKFWNLFVEKYGSPFLKGTYRAGTQVQEQQALLCSLEDLIQNAVAVLPDGSNVELIERSGGGSGNKEFSGICEYMDKQIAQAILGQNLTSDVSSGSLAAAGVHQEVKDDIVADDARIVERFFNEVFKLVRDINYPDSSAPRLSLQSPETITKELAERDKTLTETGVKFTKSYYMKRHNLEEDDFEVVEPEPKAQPGKVAEFAEGDTDSEFEDQNAVDNFIDSFSASDLQGFAEEMLKPVIKIMQESSDHSEAMEKISELYPSMKSDQLEETLSKAIYVSESFGDMSVK